MGKIEKGTFRLDSRLKYGTKKYVEAGSVIRCSVTPDVEDLVEQGRFEPVTIVPGSKVEIFDVEVGSPDLLKRDELRPEVLGMKPGSMLPLSSQTVKEQYQEKDESPPHTPRTGRKSTKFNKEE